MSSFNSFKHQLDSALDLLESSEHVKQLSLPQVLGAQMVDTESLLNRCDQICEKHKKEKPIIRIIHHLACSGGAEIAAYLSAMPNVYILNEVHPIVNFCSEYSTYNLHNVLEQAHLPKVEKLKEEIFLDNIKRIYKHVSNTGGQLVIRDTAYFDYLYSEKVSHTSIVKLLEEHFEIMSVVLWRDPIDTYASLKKSELFNNQRFNFEEYCSRAKTFISDYSHAKLVRYEDLNGATSVTLKSVCEYFQIGFDDLFEFTPEVIDRVQFDNWKPTKEDCYNTRLDTAPHLDEIGDSESYFELQKLTKPKDRKLILIATMPRSGSTWLFNCVREIHKIQNVDYYSDWIEDYDPSNQSAVHIIKAHSPEHRISSSADLIITTQRDIRDVCASLVRMKWLKETEHDVYLQAENIINYLYPFWKSKSDLELRYDDIVKNLELKRAGFEYSRFLKSLSR